MRCCLCLLLLALLTTTALGSQYYQEETGNYYDEEDLVYDEDEGCLDCQVEGNKEASPAVSKRSSGRRAGENAVLKPRWA